MVFIQGYNVIYINSKTRIVAKSAAFFASNPSLTKFLFNRSFMSAVRTKWKAKSKLSDYYEIFDKFDESGRIKTFAEKLLVDAKSEIAEGIKATQAYIDAGYKVVILTGQTAEQNAAFKAAFPIMAHEAVEIVNSYEATAEAYNALREASEKEHAIFIYGNKDHSSVTKAAEAGLIIKHYTDSLA